MVALPAVLLLELSELFIDAPARLMISDSRQLPDSNEVDVAALSRLFTETTTSYKYLFFISLLDILQRRQFEVLLPITFSELIIEMLANAWYPHTYFKLSFGTTDKIAKKLDTLDLEISEPLLKFSDTDKNLLRHKLSSQKLNDLVSYFKKYVPFRLICPFLEAELTTERVNRGRGNELELAMPTIAAKYFNTRQPLYRFDAQDYSKCQSIIVHNSWAAYIEKHYPIVRGWASWEWLNYMQKQNPSIPNVVNKIFIPQQRGSLSTQLQYWKEILTNQPFNCIYSGLPLNLDNISLDHYLPWSFVAHDRLWNLVPVRPEANSSKSNRLPSAQYFENFVRIQHLGITILYQEFNQSGWIRKVDSYINDLNLEPESLLDLDKLRNAYEATIDPLLRLAEKQGFSPNWCYTG